MVYIDSLTPVLIRQSNSRISVSYFRISYTEKVHKSRAGLREKEEVGACDFLNFKKKLAEKRLTKEMSMK